MADSITLTFIASLPKIAINPMLFKVEAVVILD